ncbi:UNVERIFIED_CONTAM: F-box protein SKIP31 [Sesamum radiatum]|uniref:F-box protein SKIP31 n=1 Tax=Sesamum radiatum TaxID=300843 RepID=A0AAW2JS78_SESRA
MASDDEDESLAYFLESEVFAELSDQEQAAKKIRIEDREISDEDRLALRLSSSSLSSVGVEAEVETSLLPLKKSDTVIGNNSNDGRFTTERRPIPRRIDTGIFSQIPAELLYHILKFLSSEDLVSCSLVCGFLNFASSDESLSPRDQEDMTEFVRSCPSEFKEYYIQMQVAKRSQAPNPSLLPSRNMVEPLIVTSLIKVSMWKSSRGLADTVVMNHACSGESCTYYQIGDVFVCEKTGNVHGYLQIVGFPPFCVVCDDTCKEVIMDPTNELSVCTISGRCFDILLSPAEMEHDADQDQGGGTDKAEPFMGCGRFARAYLLGYNCEDEKELEATLRFC